MVHRLRIYDTQTREVRLFQPIHPPRVGLFVCGLTPYAESHIGHGRSFVFFDVVARTLRRFGYRVFYVQNVTDLDDKILERAALDGVDPLQLAQRHFRESHLALLQAGVQSVNYYPFATDYIREIIEQIRQLVEKGFAYAADGSVYFEVAKFASYGRLSGQKVEELRPGARVEPDPGKRAPEDFVVWKASRPGEPSWESPWGPGRPGWHVEDTAITIRLLGERYDIHGAAIDLIFPHHEAEIALAESTTGQRPLVNYWMHAGLLTMGGAKMSKSVGNVYSLSEAVEKFGGETLRFYYLNAQYRGPLEFSAGKSLEEARDAYNRLNSIPQRLREALPADQTERPGQSLPADLAAASDNLPGELDELIADDFNTREAIARLFSFSHEVGPWLDKLDTLSGEAVGQLLAPFEWAREVLGLFERANAPPPSAALAGAVDAAQAARARARQRGDYAEADRIRDELRQAGIILEDKGGSTRWQLLRETP